MKRLTSIFLLVGIIMLSLTACDILPDNMQDQVSPTLTKAEIRDGDTATLYLVFDKQMSANIPAYPAGFSVVRNSNAMTIASVTKTTDITTYALTMTENFVQGDVVTVSYSGKPVVTSSGGGVLGVFTDQPVEFVTNSSSSSSSFSSSSSSSTGTLLLWNKLGNASEFTNSEVGPSLIWGSLVSFDTNGKFGNALFGPALGLRANRPKIPANTFYYDKFTVEFWIRKDVVDSGKPNNIVCMDDGNEKLSIAQDRGYVAGETRYSTFLSLSWDSGSKSARYGVRHTDLAGCVSFLPTGEWVHLAFTHDTTAAAGSRMKIYRNGVLQNTVVLDSIDDSGVTHVKNTIQPLLLGHYAWENDGFNGAMDNLKIYDYVKTDFSDRNVE